MEKILSKVKFLLTQKIKLSTRLLRKNLTPRAWKGKLNQKNRKKESRGKNNWKSLKNRLPKKSKNSFKIPKKKDKRKSRNNLKKKRKRSKILKNIWQTKKQNSKKKNRNKRKKKQNNSNKKRKRKKIN